jgi:hypothetical protein
MRSRSPSIVPREGNQDTIWCWTTLEDDLAAPGARPTKRSRDVTKDIADELRRRFAEFDEVPASVQEFLETASRAR